MDEEDEVVKPETARRTVQGNMRDKTMEIGGEIDELFDEFAASEYKNPEKFSVMGLLRSKSCPPQTIDIIAGPLKNQLSELTELMNPPTPAKTKENERTRKRHARTAQRRVCTFRKTTNSCNTPSFLKKQLLTVQVMYKLRK